MSSDWLLEEPEPRFGPYREALVALGEARPEVVVLGADLALSTEIDGFARRFPERFFNVGVAEQNLINVAVGLAFEGEIPFVTSFGVFVTRRPYEQVCVQVALHRANVKLVGCIPGLTSRLGPTHQAIDDLALMRTLPGLTVIDPADATEITQAVQAAAEHDGPVYPRVMRREVDALFDPERYRFRIGQVVPVLQETDRFDVALFTTGLMLAPALEAAGMLRDRSISCGVWHVPTLKPLDVEAVREAAASARVAVTVENHLQSGGLGTAVAEVLAEAGLGRPLCRLGLRDEFAAPGTPDYLFARYGLTAADIARLAGETLERRP